MSEAPERIWIHWLAANQMHLAYDEPPPTEYDECQDAYVRADREAKLVEALRSIAANTCCGTCQEAALVARAALREFDE